MSACGMRFFTFIWVGKEICLEGDRLSLRSVICYWIADSQISSSCSSHDNGVIGVLMFPVLSQPCFGVFDDRHQIQPDKEVRSRPAWSFAQPIDFLLL